MTQTFRASRAEKQNQRSAELTEVDPSVSTPDYVCTQPIPLDLLKFETFGELACAHWHIQQQIVGVFYILFGYGDGGFSEETGISRKKIRGLT